MMAPFGSFFWGGLRFRERFRRFRQFQGCCIIAVCYKWCFGHWPPLLHIIPPTKYLFMSQGTTQSWNSQGTKAHGGRNPGDVLSTGAAWWSARGVVGWRASSRHRGRRCRGWRWKVSREMNELNEFLQPAARVKRAKQIGCKIYVKRPSVLPGWEKSMRKMRLWDEQQWHDD